MSKSYKRQRLEDYPPIGEQLDEIWKALDQMKTDGIVLPQPAIDALDTVKAVKVAHPKPGA